MFNLIVNLPAVESPDERKALMIATNCAHLGIFLDWQGSNVEFTTRLLEGGGRRDKGTLVGFLEELSGAPQVSIERRDRLTELREQQVALDDAAWREAFG